MEIKKKELGEDIITHLDFKNYKSFINDVKNLIKKYEFSSNHKSLNYSVLFNCRKRPQELVKGWASRVLIEGDSIKEVIFLDYDGILYKLMKSELLALQNKYNLSPFYIFKSFETTEPMNGEIYGNYLAVSITKLDYAEAYSVIGKTHADNSYKVVPTSYPWKTWVLRLGKKFKKPMPEFKEIIGDLGKKYDMPCSQAHLDILGQLAPEIINKVKYTNLDNNHELFLSNYMTASK